MELEDIEREKFDGSLAKRKIHPSRSFFSTTKILKDANRYSNLPYPGSMGPK